MGQVDDAAKAYRAADAALTRAKAAAAQRVRDAQAAKVAARERLAAAIVAEAQAGTPQVEIVRASGYTREGVRRILRAAGIEADP